MAGMGALALNSAVVSLGIPRALRLAGCMRRNLIHYWTEI
jgi:hypothetical protein